MKKISFFFFFLFFFAVNSFAEKITILYTGQTHAALYPCACPKEPDGGVARRMAKIKQLRAGNPHTLLVEAGNFFAGGGFDEHSQGVELDKARTESNLKALGEMGYDAVSISDDELNFGKEYLAAKIKESGIPFVSANLKIEGARAYILKQVGNTSFAIIGLTNEEAAVKASTVALEDARSSLQQVIEELKGKNEEIVTVVLSSLGEENDKELLAQVPGVDLLISGRYTNAADQFDKVGSAYLVRPFWQGRRLSRVELEIENSRISNITLEQIRLSSELPDAPEIAKIVPQCFADSDCKKQGLKGHCNNPASTQASCSYEKPKNIPLLIIQPKNLKVPNQDKIIESFKSVFPGLEERFIDSDSKAGKSLVKETGAALLPVYLLEKDADKEKNFARMVEHVELKGAYYYVKPQFAGGVLFVGRKKIPNKLDVFMGTKGAQVEGILSVLRQLRDRYKEVEITLHYLAIEAHESFATPSGLPELEEDMRHVCVRQHHPERFWDYALCRAKQQESSWWDICAEQFSIDTKAIKGCCLLGEGSNLLKENIRLNRELRIAGGPTFVVNNNEVFTVNGVPKIEQLEQILGLQEVKK